MRSPFKVEPGEFADAFDNPECGTRQHPMNDKALDSRTNRRVHPKTIEKRQQILDAAARALAEHGYSEMKLSDIARQAGTHAGSLYYYFPSREALVKEVLQISAARMFEIADSLTDDNARLTPIDHVMSFVRKMIDQRTSMRNDYYMRAILLNYAQVPDNIRKELRAKPRRVRRILVNLMDEAKVAGQIPDHVDTVAATQFIFGAISWMGLWYEPAGRISTDKITETFLDLTLHGLAGKRRARKLASTAPVLDARPPSRRAQRDG